MFIGWCLFRQSLLKCSNNFFLPAEPVGTGPVQETEDCIELKVAKATIQKLRKEKYEAELLNVRLEKEVNQLGNTIKDVRKHLQRKGEVCEQNCVLCCLLWIFHNKLNIHACGRHIEKIITNMISKITKKKLRCHSFMSVLVECEIARKIPDEMYSPSSPTATKDNIRDQKINDAWQILLKEDAEHVLIVSKVISKAERTGHSVVCDLKSRNNDSLTYNDVQKDKVDIWNEHSFKSYFEDGEGIRLYIVDMGSLKQLIKNHQDNLHEICKISLTETGSNCMVAAHATSAMEHAIATTEQVTSSTEQHASPTDQVTSPTEQVIL